MIFKEPRLHLLISEFKTSKFVSSYTTEATSSAVKERATTRLTHNSSYVAADGHSPYIASRWKWMMVIIDRSKAYMTGSSNDECARRQQVDSMVWYLVSPLLSQRESPAQHPSSAQGNGKHGNLFCLSPQSFSFYPPFVCVCVHSTQLFHFIRF